MHVTLSPTALLVRDILGGTVAGTCDKFYPKSIHAFRDEENIDPHMDG